MVTQIQLSEPEVELLERLLARAIGDIKAEVRHTMSSVYKVGLREEEALLVGLHRRLAAQAA